MGVNGRKTNIRWLLLVYDAIIWLAISGLMLWLHPSQAQGPGLVSQLLWMAVGLICIIGMRLFLGVYEQVLRYGGVNAYLRMMLADGAGTLIYVLLIKLIPDTGINFILALSMGMINLLIDMLMRMQYYLIYKQSGRKDLTGELSRVVLRIFGRMDAKADSDEKLAKDSDRQAAAIVGAGRVGLSLAQELIDNPNSQYTPVCFVDKDPTKIGRRLLDLPIIYESDNIVDILKSYGAEAVIIALPEASILQKTQIYSAFKTTDMKVMIYDVPISAAESGKFSIRKFTVEELLARKPIKLDDEELNRYYRGKTVMITGGGGSIGSELSRQIAAMAPRKLIIVDIAENTSYELQQELRMKYMGKLDLNVEICDITVKAALEKVFDAYRPQVVIHAAAHKHVPLMEHNSVECIRNNVFGTLNAVELSKKYGVLHFIMVSTDKAVNPTNIMGASKRMCELIVEDAGRKGGCVTRFSATRFGNVLGSAGSVIPLFKKQIAQGGPVTVTDKEIIRYFMTIPEASQLVLTSGAMAENGELYVLDMGKPVKIYDMAENMIRLSGYVPGADIEIVETGLRPGEKKFEELLINAENQERTGNDLIFVERDEGISHQALEEGLARLQEAVEAGDDRQIKLVMAGIVDTYSPEIEEQ